MGYLALKLFGGIQAFLDEKSLAAFESDKARALLAYLAVENNHAHRREKLAALLWPDVSEKRARQSLSQALYSLRALLGDRETESPKIEATPQQIQLCGLGQCHIDVLEFQHLFHSCEQHDHRRIETCPRCVAQLQAAIDLYQGCFLDGFSIPDSKSFEEWIILKRECLQQQAENVLRTLATHHSLRNNYPQAIEYARKQVELDPWRESAHRQLMQFLALDGQRSAALYQYKVCCEALAEELDVQPQSKTTNLFEQIRDGQGVPTPYASPPHNLPAPLTHFVGRDDELKMLHQYLIDPACRLITIVGPGGIGKTRLAIACAQRQLENSNSHIFPDGVFFVPLAGTDAADQISAEIVKALRLSVMQGGMAGQARSGIDQQLFDFLRHKRMLLVLDNFEQLLEGAHSITEFLKIAPQICILITSRQRLHLKGEQVFPIGGLTYPLLDSLEDACSYTAIELFMNNARRLKPDFDLNPENLIHLVNICRMLDGLPLGMELATSWTELLSLEEIGTEIQRNIGFLKSDWVDLPERHHSLLAVCDTTWRLMHPSEQDLFARLSVFRGGFTIAAAQEVADTSIRDLQVLKRKSLLDYDQVNKRYRVHPYLRQYGYEQLSTNPEGEFQARDAHSAFFCAQLKAHNDTYEAGNLQMAVERVEMEFANIQVAWDWAVAQGDLERIDQGILGLSHFLLYNSRYYEALTICRLVNEKLASNTTQSTPNAKLTENIFLLERVHAKAINYQGYFSTFFNEDQAARLYEESLEKLNKLEEAGYDVRLEKAQVLILKSGRGDGARYHTDLQSSKVLLLESIALLEETERYWWTFFGLIRLGETCSELGSHQEAKIWLEQGYDLAKKAHNQHHEIYFLDALGYVNWKSGDYVTAFNYFREAHSLAISYHRHGWVIGILNSWGNLSLFLGRLDEAAASYQQAIAIAEEKSSIRDASAPLENLGVTQWLAGAFENAKKTLLMAVDFPEKISDFVVIFPNSGYIELLTLTGRYREAAKKIDWANECIDVNGWPSVSARLSRVLGWLAMVNHHYTEAKEYFQASIERFPYDAEINRMVAGWPGRSRIWFGSSR